MTRMAGAAEPSTERIPQKRLNPWQTVSAAGIICYSGYAPVLAAGRQILFPWDGSLRSALFPRKEYLATCLNKWICEVRFSRDPTLSVRLDLAFLLLMLLEKGVSHISQLIRRRNSSRVCGCERKFPSMHDVVIIEFCFCTPRIIMHICCASITTPTPCASMAVFTH